MNTHNTLPAPARKKIIAILTPLLADAQDLYSHLKQAHWNVRGANFIALHELFDKVASEASGVADELAERIVQLGGEPQGTLRAAAKATRLKEYGAKGNDAAKHVAAVASSLAQFTAKSRDAIDKADEAGDAVTADTLTSITSGLDKQLWFVEAHLG